MSNDKVKCQCCGKMMVPRVVFSRGWYVGWGVRIGGGRPKYNICPFCLSEDWRGASDNRAEEIMRWNGRGEASTALEKNAISILVFAAIFAAILLVAYAY